MKLVSFLTTGDTTYAKSDFVEACKEGEKFATASRVVGHCRNLLVEFATTFAPKEAEASVGRLVKSLPALI